MGELEGGRGRTAGEASRGGCVCSVREGPVVERALIGRGAAEGSGRFGRRRVGVKGFVAGDRAGTAVGAVAGAAGQQAGAQAGGGRSGRQRVGVAKRAESSGGGNRSKWLWWGGGGGL